MLGDFSVKAYIYNVCALLNGFKAMDRKKPPKVDVEPAVEGEAKPMLKQTDVQQFGDYKNQLDKAGYMFGDIDNFYRQKLICQIIGPTAEFHGRTAPSFPAR
eukprot:85079-Pyramimonas_sp.AAC.2